MLPEDLALTPEEIGELLTAYGYTQEAAGRVLGVTKGTISKWVTGTGKPSAKRKAQLRGLTPIGDPESAAKYQAEAEAKVARHRRGADPKAIAEAIAGILADKFAPLKVNAEELAELLAKKIDAKGIAPTVAGQLLPELRKEVEAIAQKFAATVDGQEDFSELATRLADCVALLLKLKQPDTSEVAGAVVDKSRGLFATLKDGLDSLALSVKDGLDSLTGMLRGLQAKADSQATQDAQKRAEDRAKRDELGNGMRGLQAQAGELKTGVQQLQAKADELGKGVKGLDAKTNAHHEQTGRWLLALGGIMVAGFVGVIVTVVACAHAGGPIPGAGQTRGGGVAGDAAGKGQWPYGSLASHGIDAGLGERKVGRPMPHEPLPHQATAPCQGSARTLYGSCWLLSGDPAPCPPDQFQEGGKCYYPMAADPGVPVGTEPKRSGQEMPTREQIDAGMPGKKEEQ